MKHLLISAAEPSGDQLAADLVHALSKREPLVVEGLAGPRMRAAGVRPIANMEDVCAMGTVEVMKKLPSILDAKRHLKHALAKRPCAAIFIDAPDLHLPLGRYAKKLGVQSIGWVCPQVWAWRKGRTKTITQSFDKLMCLFDFEPELFSEIDARFTGHPVVDRMTKSPQRTPNLYGLAPGSREHETKRLWPIFVEVAKRIRTQNPSAEFIVVSPVDSIAVPDWIQRRDHAQDFSSCRGVLTKSGTITLELAALGVPQVVAHKVHPFTAWLGRRPIRGIDHIAMPNILSKNEVIPEFLQDLDPTQLSQAMLNLPNEQSVDLTALGSGDSIDRTASLVYEWMGAA